MVCSVTAAGTGIALLLVAEVVPALSGAENGANDGKLELSIEAEMAETGALFGNRLAIVSDAKETGCKGGRFKDKVDAGKQLEGKLEELVLLGINEEW